MTFLKGMLRVRRKKKVAKAQGRALMGAATYI